MLDLLTDLIRQESKTILLVLHDLNLACRYADHLIAMQDGDIVAQGPPRETVTEQLIEAVFDLPCRVVADPVSQTPMIVPIDRHHADDQRPVRVTNADCARADLWLWTSSKSSSRPTG